MSAIFTDDDLRQMEELGISEEEARRQLELFRDPPPPVRLDRPATVGDGILKLPQERREGLGARFDRAMARGAASKMVPASGAATRMFKSLRSWLERARAAAEEGLPTPEPSDPVTTLLEHLGDFPFAADLAGAARRAGHDLEDLVTRGDAVVLLELLLTDEGLGYSDRPKGLIPFHRYPGYGARTAFEEHLVEAAAYTRDGEDRCRLHFTVAPEHEASFRELLEGPGRELGDAQGARFEVEFSHQSHATDTLAVTPEDEPFRLEDGSLLFRPGGHGALIENLDALARAGADVVFLKNIDNVVPEGRQGVVTEWKKLLGGVLLELRERTFELIEELAAPTAAADGRLLEKAEGFLAEELHRPLPAGSSGDEERRRACLDHLDRPLRVCGMVVNEGEPGGGPFWVRSEKGDLSLQIVEMSQIDTEDPGQRRAVSRATHFNPVDLACSLKDREGRPYDLHRFLDPDTVFIAEKSHRGRPLKALERPGLWNGAMAGWNTVFVEVPIETFAPVKTVFDLLRPEHQGRESASA